MTVYKLVRKKISSEQIFMLSVLLVNGGNYLYNLLLGRLLGPAVFAEAALLVTLLLVLSFVGMTFQLASAKFAVLLEDTQWARFRFKIYKGALLGGCVAMLLLIMLASSLQDLFLTRSSNMFIVFAIGIPIYFVMSVNRGIYQGKLAFNKLATTYQTEMWSRLGITLLLLWALPFDPATIVALGILISLFFGMLPTDLKNFRFDRAARLTTANTKLVSTFIVLTACYEGTQIIINNSDILMVKHYFEATQAGLYASLALIGRVVYFIAWMFVMILLPTVVQRKKDGLSTAPVLFKYVLIIGVFSTIIVTACWLFPELIVQLMFGEDYLAISSLLWKYATATSLFAISNIFAYYYLSLDHYVPVIISGILGFSQIALIALYHDSLEQVVVVQIIAMAILLLFQLVYFVYKNNKNKKELLKAEPNLIQNN